MINQRNQKFQYLLVVCFTMVTLKYLGHIGNFAFFKQSLEISQNDNDIKLANFYRTWCDIRKYRRDWEKMQKSCKDLMPWRSKKEAWNESTDSSKSVIISKDIRPTYEFSRIFIESRSVKGKRKKIGGDSWRVHLRGPSIPVTTVYDLQNGTYEVVFLLFESGKYTVSVYLEHSLCDGIKDPPDDWFKIGNAQGKYQPDGSLGNDYPYISKKMNVPSHISTIYVQDQKSEEYLRAISFLMNTKASICNDSCNLIWDGYGRWVDDKWHPYKTERGNLYQDQSNRSSEPRKKFQANYNGKLWFYGDSVMEQFYNNVKIFGNLCKMFTSGCGHTYNWVYRLRGFNTTLAKTENDDKDFNITRILEEVSSVAYLPSFNTPDSVIFINLGLHFVQGVKFDHYKILINGIIDLLRTKYVGKVIWRTTTAINKHKVGEKHRQRWRFFNHQRVLLFNAFATNQMCSAGIPVLDLFPLTDSYPNSTGVRGVKNDAAHYEHIAFSTAERLLEDIFRRREI